MANITIDAAAPMALKVMSRAFSVSDSASLLIPSIRLPKASTNSVPLSLFSSVMCIPGGESIGVSAIVPAYFLSRPGPVTTAGCRRLRRSSRGAA
jgi:hypothetical protein